MNYLSIYKSIIRKAKRERGQRLFNRKNKLEYYEEHHFIPKSIMLLRKPWLEDNRKKSNLMNKPWNIVLLTAREHFLIHRVLVKIVERLYGQRHDYTFKMIHAINYFTNMNNDTKSVNYKITARTYAFLRNEISRIGVSDETKHKMVEKWKLRGPVTKETRAKQRLAKLGTHPSEETRKLLRIGHARERHWAWNRPVPQTTKEKRRKTCNDPTWILYHNDGTIDIVDNLSEYCRTNNYNRPNIWSVCTGNRQFHKDIIRVDRRI
jgi:hypothetical protein